MPLKGENKVKWRVFKHRRKNFMQWKKSKCIWKMVKEEKEGSCQDQINLAIPEDVYGYFSTRGKG